MLKQGLHRTNSIVYKDLNDHIQIIQYQTDCVEYALNETALWIWFLVEPNTTKEELIEKVIAAYPDLSIEQVEEEIDVLITQGLIEQRDHNQVCSLIDNLNVYIDCFDDIIKNKSYLLRFLCHVANMTTVVSEIDQADVVFCTDPNTIEDDDDRLFVLITESPTEAQAMVFDYIISCKEAWSPHHLKWTRFPTAAFNQDEYEKIVEETDPGYSIERIATRFRHFLTGQEDNTETKSRVSEVDKPLLTIGMATHDDYDGLYFSLTSLQIHHPSIFAQSEIVILDNNPDGKEALHLEALAACNANVRYVPYRDKNSTAVRDILFSVAKGEWVLCMDSHVMLPGGVLQQLVDYMTKNPDSKDLLQGPILDDSGQVYASHFKACLLYTSPSPRDS